MILGRKKHNRNGRITVIIIGYFLFFSLIVWRLFELQIVNKNYYRDIAGKTHEILMDLAAERGEIYIKENFGDKENIFPLVINKNFYRLYAAPKEIEDAEATFEKINSVLKFEKNAEEISLRLKKKNDPYEPIAEKVSPEQAREIEKLNLAGMYLLPVKYRFLTEKNFSGQVLGFVRQNEKITEGQYGLEGYFDDELSGKQGLLKATKDALGFMLTIGERHLEEPEDGDTVVLTIDRSVQNKSCQEIKAAVEYYEAKDGTVIVMSPDGALLSMCSWPDFDSENYNGVDDINIYNNPAIFYPYEPGSVFKPITMAMGLDLGLITPETKYVDTGSAQVGEFTIHNSDMQAHGEQTMTQVIEKSLNTGAIFVADKVGKKNFIRYSEDFGFGQKTGITLDSEMPGDISNLKKKGPAYVQTASYGQGIAATPVQLIAAFGAIANDGKLTRPYIVDSFIKPNGETVKNQPQELRQVIKSSTAHLVQGMMVAAVKSGYSEKAAIAGYSVAGKTGTAQVASGEGGYGENTIHSFIGFAPVDDPAFVMLIKLTYPKKVKHASDTIAPIFSEIGGFVLNYYQIAPDEPVKGN
ncbi:penicillin-binding protein 2 [Candidatus Parcubacteria bacterium]|nr:MAG: penicillin-binding protein 2 [Candidatus Parcubacteria bacterium]